MLSKKDQSALLNDLDEVALSKIDRADFKALMRLQVWFAGRTHEIFGRVAENAQKALLDAAENDLLDAASAFTAQVEIYDDWGAAFAEWSALFERVREEAIWLAFGVQAQYHERILRPALVDLEESKGAVQSGRALLENISDGVFEPQLRILTSAAAEYVYGDGLTLSGRVWQIDRDARSGINDVLINAVQTGDSAYRTAKNLEQYLGANQDCPRWTSTRLYGQTPSTRRTSAAGLIRGTDCNGQGVSYKALRLARTEIQRTHDLALERQASSLPFVDYVQVNLSPGHKKDANCECDSVASGGKDGKGIYPVGTINLPIHPNCMCFKTMVLMPGDAFFDRLNGWVDGSKPWAEMDAYENSLGGDVDVNLRPAGLNLAVWLLSDKLDDWMAEAVGL